MPHEPPLAFPIRCLVCATVLTTAAISLTSSLGDEIVVNPSGPPARSYSTASELRGEWARLQDQVRRLPGSPRLSMCLSRAAAHYADHRGPNGDDRLPQAAIEYLLHRAGCPDATASATVVYTTEHGTRDVLEELRTLLSHPEFAATTHVGLGPGRGEGNPYRWRWGIFLTTRRFELQRFPAAVEPAATAPLQVRLEPGLVEPRVILLAPGGDVRETSVGASGAWAVASLDFGTTVGTAWVELVADTVTGPAVLALFPVFVGTDPPRDWRGPPPPDESALTSAREAARLMFSLLNRDRRRHGLPELEWSDDLAETATAHSRDMAESGFFGHRSPRRGDLLERLGRSSLSVLYSSENLSRSDSIAEAQSSLMRSPGHRANILSTMPTEVGVGAVRESGIGTGWLVTQLFAKPRPRLGDADWRWAVRKGLRERFALESRPIPAERPELNDVANELVTNRPSVDATGLAELAAALLEDRGIGYGALLVHRVRAWTADQLQMPDPGRTPAGAEIGIGVRSRGPDQPVSIVVLFVR